MRLNQLTQRKIQYKYYAFYYRLRNNLIKMISLILIGVCLMIGIDGRYLLLDLDADNEETASIHIPNKMSNVRGVENVYERKGI